MGNGPSKVTVQDRIRHLTSTLNPAQKSNFDRILEQKDAKLRDLDRENQAKLKQKENELKDLMEQLKWEEKNSNWT